MVLNTSQQNNIDMDTHGSDYLQLLNHSPLTVIVSDEKDQLIFANDHAKETFGFDHRAAPSSNVRKFHSKHPESWNVIKQKAKTKGTYAFESIAKKQTGGIIDIWVICDAISFNGEPAFAVFIRDISDQQIIIKEHFKERQFRQLILDSIPAMVFVKDKENRLIAMNKAYQVTTGYSIEKYLGRKVSDFMSDKELADQFWKDDLEVMQTGLPKRNIVEPLINNPNRFYVTDKIPYKTMDGEIIGVIGFSVEITERKNAENALIESEKKFRLLFDTSPEGVILATLDGKIVSTNKAFQSITGYTAEELPELSFSDIVADVDKESELPILRNSLMFGETVDSVERNYRRKDGTIIPVQVKGWVIKNESGVPVQQGAFVKDISFRRTVEKLETSLIEKEKQQLEIELEAKNRELNSKIAQLIEKNGLVASAADQLEKLIAHKPKKMEVELRKIIEELTEQNNEDFWRQFEITFEQINKSFYDNLYEKYPRLSSNEKKICAFLKMNLSTKDISNITHQSSRSIEMARTRLRKKLNLKRSDNLGSFLAQF